MSYWPQDLRSPGAKGPQNLSITAFSESQRTRRLDTSPTTRAQNLKLNQQRPATVLEMCTTSSAVLRENAAAIRVAVSHLSSAQLLDNRPHTASSPPPRLASPLLPGHRRSFVLLLNLITLRLALSEGAHAGERRGEREGTRVRERAIERHPYCSSLQHFVLLVHYFTHALLFYQALLK